MATRTTSLESKIIKAMQEWETPATVAEIAAEVDSSDVEVFKALNTLEDAGKVSGEGRGLTSTWSVGTTVSDAPVKETPKTEETPRPKRKRRTKAEMEAAREEERKRIAYAANVAESQDGDMQHATPRVIDAPAVVPAVEPVKDSQGETVTVPVDYDDPSKGRRELDASQGERLISEDTYTVRTPLPRTDEGRAEYVAAFVAEAPKTAEAVQALIRKLQGLPVMKESDPEAFSVTFHEPKNGEALDVEIPPIPAGVHPHTWELAFQGNTEGARRYHRRQAEAQEAEYLMMAEAEEHAKEYENKEESDVPPF